jgi:hypothetical protein
MGDLTTTAKYQRNKDMSSNLGNNASEGPVTGTNQVNGTQTEGVRPNSPDTQAATTDKTSFTSPGKAAANRLNAGQSTGPKSIEGKKRASRKSVKHGILAKDTVISAGEGAEDAAEFENLLQQLRENTTPKTFKTNWISRSWPTATGGSGGQSAQSRVKFAFRLTRSVLIGAQDEKPTWISQKCFLIWKRTPES